MMINVAREGKATACIPAGCRAGGLAVTDLSLCRDLQATLKTCWYILVPFRPVYGINLRFSLCTLLKARKSRPPGSIPQRTNYALLSL